MIKLIASDLDGTLLDPAGKLPAETYSVIEKLHRKGILFCAASGRQLTALETMFAPVADKIVLIAENGALIARGGKILYSETVSPEAAERTLCAVREFRNAYPLLCTPSRAYYEDEALPFSEYVRASYISNERGELARIARREKICKIAVYDGEGPERNCMRRLPAMLPDLRVTMSGGNWLDVSGKTAHKGFALQRIQREYSLAPSECAAFGDHMNDYEMLTACGYPFATENAYPALKEKIAGRVPSNAEGGALRAMLALAEGTMPTKEIQ